MTKKQIAKRFKEVGLKFETKEPLFGICIELDNSNLHIELSKYISTIDYILPTRFHTNSLGYEKENDYIRAILCYLISEAVKSE